MMEQCRLFHNRRSQYRLAMHHQGPISDEEKSRASPTPKNVQAYAQGYDMKKCKMSTEFS